MQIDENILKKFSEAEIPDDYIEVPRRLAAEAAEVLGEEESVKVKRRFTKSEKLLLCWSKNERNKRKRARKAQRKARKG